jgi:hypothetical protein
VENVGSMKKLILSNATAAQPTRRIHPPQPIKAAFGRWRHWQTAALLLLLVAIAAASANEVAPNALLDPGGPADPNPLQPLLDGLLGKYGWLTTVILVIGTLRLLFKPVMLTLENYVKQTASPNDDERLAKFEAGPVYKVISFALDLGASIKLPLIAPRSNIQPPKE